MNSPLTIEQNLNKFSHFITLLTGHFNISVVTSLEKEKQGCIVLPPLENIDSQSLEVLYGLCLREAGFLAKSKKTQHSLELIHTQHQLRATMIVESARIEKFLIRHFAGAGEMLDEHFSTLAQLPSYTSTILGLDPHHTYPEYVFLMAFKWHLLNRPAWGWETIFPTDLWNTSLALLESPDIHSIIKQPLKKFDDSISVAQQALAFYYTQTGQSDTSLVREKTSKQCELEKTQEKLEEYKVFVESQNNLLLQYQNDIEYTQEQLEKEKQAIEPISKPIYQQIEKIKHIYPNLTHRELRQFIKSMETLNKFNDKITRTEKALQTLDQKIQQHPQTEVNYSDKIEQTQQHVQNMNDKLQEKLQKIEDNLTELTKKESEYQNKSDLASSPSQQTQWEQKKEHITQKIENLLDKKNDVLNKIQHNKDTLSEKTQNLNNKAQQQLLSQKKKEQNYQDKRTEIQKKWNILDEQKNNMEKQIIHFAQHLQKKQELIPLDQMFDDLKNLTHLSLQLDEIERPLQSIKKELTEKTRTLSNEKKKMNWKMEKTLQEMEKSLQKEGIEISFTQQMDEMSNWNEANEIQAQFDHSTSEEKQQSVINGRGGGFGNRDMLVTLNHFQQHINELNPSQLFADVEALSPLNGFSENQGVSKSQGNTSSVHIENSLSLSTSPISKHTVWDTSHDKIITNLSPRMAELSVLQTKYRKEIKEIRQLFSQHFKPSFKQRFIGGKDEGSLDNRSLWRLATQQGDDFFEELHKKPHHKSFATILVDLSGSCSSIDSDVEQAQEKIQTLVLLLSEGLSSVKIPHEILGYYAPIDPDLAQKSIPASFNRKMCRLETRVIKSFHEQKLTKLPHLEIQDADNSDGESLKLAVQRLEKQPGHQKMLFMISDGKPFMQDSQAQILDHDLFCMYHKAQQKKIAIYPLGFSEHHAVLDDVYWSIPSVQKLASVLKEHLFQKNNRV